MDHYNTQKISIRSERVHYQYDLKKSLGQGSYGKVFKGKVIKKTYRDLSYQGNREQNRFHSNLQQLQEGMIVAIKQFKGSYKTLKADKKRRIKFDRQANILASLIKAQSEYIIRFYQAFDDPDQDKYYVIMEYAQQGTFQKLINYHKQENIYIPQAQLYRLFLSLAQGVKFLHFQCLKNSQACIIHRDLKPSNILVSQSMSCKIIDFGFSKRININQEATIHTLCGTPPYQSPQILSKLPFSKKADIWSIGIILWELLTLKRPFKKQVQRYIIINAQKNIAQMINNLDLSHYDNSDFWKRILRNALALQQKNRADAQMLNSLLRQSNLLKPKVIINSSEYLQNEKDFRQIQKQVQKSKVKFFQTKIQSVNQQPCQINQTKIKIKKITNQLRRQYIQKIILCLFQQKIEPISHYIKFQIILLKIISLCFYLNTYNSIRQNFSNQFFKKQFQALQNLFKIFKQMENQSQLSQNYWKSIRQIIPQLRQKLIQNDRNGSNKIYLEDVIKVTYQQNMISQENMQNIKCFLFGLWQNTCNFFQDTLLFEPKCSNYLMSFYLLLELLNRPQILKEPNKQKLRIIQYCKKFDEILQKISSVQTDYQDIQKIRDDLIQEYDDDIID